MLGYSFGRPTNRSHFGRVSNSFAMDNVKCTGSEDSLLDCPHETQDDCNGDEGAGVICSNTGRFNPGSLDVITEAIFPLFLIRFWACGCTKT